MGKVKNVNPSLLCECREQVGLDIEIVRKTIKSIKELEAGEKKPTFRQLENLADLYGVPDWVFIATELPEKYRFKAYPAFRSFSQEKSFNHSKLRKFVIRIEHLRKMILEFREDRQEPLAPFSPPKYINGALEMASSVRRWLNVDDQENLSFKEWREKLEAKDIFIFMTSKYRHWSQFSTDDFRGLSIFKETLPIVIVNDSDAKKAQSFTLFHELGHLLKKQSFLDIEMPQNSDEETWCDLFSANVLMPESDFIEKVKQQDLSDLDLVKGLAKVFKVSPYACIVRLLQLNKITRDTYNLFQNKIKAEYKALQKKQRDKKGGPSRHRHKEVLHQFGRLYSNTVWQAYHDKEISLHKLCKLLNLKRTQQVLDMKEIL